MNNPNQNPTDPKRNPQQGDQQQQGGKNPGQQSGGGQNPGQQQQGGKNPGQQGGDQDQKRPDDQKR